MSMKDLSDKYGRAKSRVLVNRAIREEVVAGREVLDALDQCIRASTLRGEGRIDESLAAYNHAASLIANARDAMGDEIARRYGIGPRAGDDNAPESA